MSEDIKLLSHLARVSLVNARTEDLLQVIRDRGYIDDDFLASTTTPLFFFRAEISNNLLDSHFTHMSTKTLQNYAADAERGVAFLRGHNWHELPIGYSLTGEFEDGEKQRVTSDFYTVPGSAETDDLIFRMRHGLVRDVSVGFHGGRVICDLCGSDFWDCRHFPGLKYEEKDGDTVRIQLATFTIDDANLSEVSGVFDGSTPEAMVLKAQRAAKAGELTQEQVRILESRYRIALPVSRSFTWTTIPTQENKKMDERQVARLKELVIISGIVPQEQHASLDEETTLVFVDKLVSRVKSLEPEAEMGRQYKDDLVKEAVAEGVRALGGDFDATLYEQTLRSSPITVVKRMRDDWKKTADATLPAGRHSVEKDTRTPESKGKVAVVPDRAYAV